MVIFRQSNPKRHASVAEVIIGIIFVFSYVWIISPLYDQWIKIVVVVFFALFIGFSEYRNGTAPADIGLFPGHFKKPFGILAIFTLFSILTTYGIWKTFFPINEVFFSDPDLWKASLSLMPRGYLEALLQGYLFFGFFFLRFRAVFYPRTIVAVGFSALVYSLIHIPTPPLMIFCFVAGIVWTATFHRYPNLYVTALSHAVLGIYCAFVLSAYTTVGPKADLLRWSRKDAPVYAYIDSVNGRHPLESKNFVVETGNKDTTLLIMGWLVSHHPIERAVLMLGNHVYPIQTGEKRPDVAEYFNDSRFMNCGFCTRLPLEGYESGCYRLFIKVYLKDEYWYRIPNKRVWVRMKRGI